MLRIILYIPIQILFLPLSLIGALWVGYKQMVVSHRLGISQTAIEVLNGRWTMHVFGLRNDIATAKLAASVPNNSVYGLWLALFPLWLIARVSRKPFLYPRVAPLGAENLGDLMIARTRYFDEVIARAAPGISQFVVMGAGYDTRCYGELLDRDVACFEIDQPQVQAQKRRGLAEAKIDSSHVSFVEVDFSMDNTFDKLKKAGYDNTKPTLFLWEGVTLYLSESDVRKTLQDIYHNSTKGSIILTDLYADRMIKLGKSKTGEKLLGYTNEGLGFGLDLAGDFKNTLFKFAQSESLSIGETYFMGKNNARGPFMVVAELLR